MTVRVITISAEDAIVVPVGALFPQANAGMAVYVLDDNHARLRPVELMARNGQVGWVRSGLNPDERVLVYPPSSVTDGTWVRVRR